MRKNDLSRAWTRATNHLMAHTQHLIGAPEYHHGSLFGHCITCGLTVVVSGEDGRASGAAVEGECEGSFLE